MLHASLLSLRVDEIGRHHKAGIVKPSSSLIVTITVVIFIAEAGDSGARRGNRNVQDL